jgi:hypothetical protein
MKRKSVISLISYDADYLPNSIAKYYNYVDEIVLGLDSDRITWSGNSFKFDESKLWSELQRIDGDNKISVIEESFHPSSIAIENDNYERNFLKAQCSNDWIFSFDADEYLINAKDFFYNFCPIAERYYNSVDICMHWVTPFKQIEDSILVIAGNDNSPFIGEIQGVTTSSDSTYTYARWTNKSASGKGRIVSPLTAIHWSLCRPREQLIQKLHNHGHSDLADKDPFFSIWDSVTLENYSQLQNFKTSGLGGPQWPRLVEVDADSLESYVKDFIGSAY